MNLQEKIKKMIVVFLIHKRAKELNNLYETRIIVLSRNGAHQEKTRSP